MSVLSEAPTSDRMISPREAAEVLGVHINFVYGRLLSGELPSRKLGSNRRIWFSDLQHWVNNQ